MKTFTNILLAGAFAVAAIAVSAAPSEAAKRHKKPGLTPVAACAIPGTACTMPGTNVVHMCGGDHKWVAALNPGCRGPGCPAPCL